MDENVDKDELNKNRDYYLKCMARVVLAIQASGREEVHADFIEIIN